MAGHSPAPVVAAVTRRLAELGGASAMLPTEDAAWVGAELARRFGVPRWSFALTATDANRWAIRLLRAVTGRPRILVNSYCYHGSVDESLIVVGPDGRARSREGNVGAPCDVTLTSRVAEFNDLDALARELAHGDVAAVLMEPALTNIGIVLPEPGYLAGVRELTRAPRHVPGERRDPHVLRRARRRHPGMGAGAGRGHDRQGDRRWLARRSIRAVRRPRRGAGRPG